MRKHDVRKWLHAVLDLLPVILIPVFMIYSHRHDVTENVEVQYKYQSNEVNSNDDLIEGNLYNFVLDDYQDILNGRILFFDIVKINSISANHIETISSSVAVDYTPYYHSSARRLYFFAYDLNATFYYDVSSFDILVTFKETDVNIPNLYTFFSYTSYNEVESVDIENSDVMDSFINHFNTTIANHFNMGNVFNLNGVYQWFNTNIFSGNAPTVIYSIWNIALYELVMDLLFLLYGLFMWFIDMIQKLMEKPLNSVK